MLKILPFDYQISQPSGDGLHISMQEPLLLAEGQKIVLTGRSGIGKSTFLKLILDLIPQQSTAKVWNDQVLTTQDFSELKKKEIAFVSQHYALVDHLTVLENIWMPLKLLGETITQERENNALVLLKALGLLGFEKRMPSTLSQGEKQRIALIRALILQPKLLILDEPTAHLDRQNAQKIIHLLLSLSSTVLMVSHDPECKLLFPFQLYFEHHPHTQILNPKLVKQEKAFTASLQNQSLSTINDQNDQDQASPTHIEAVPSFMAHTLLQNIPLSKAKKQPFFMLSYGSFYAFRSILYYKKRYLLLSIALTLAFALLLLIQGLSERYQVQLQQRAQQTPLLMGKLGSRYDLLMSALYFKDKSLQMITQGDWEALNELALGISVPLYVKWTAHKAPIVATNIDYFEQRALILEAGTLFSLNGEAVVGAAFAKQQGIGIGDFIYSDQSNLYDLAASYPLKIKVTGILKKAHSPDDFAVFCELKTAWIIAGFAHGHQKQEGVSEDASLLTYQEINAENINDFHFHGDEQALPLSSILIFPTNAKEKTLLKGKYQRHSFLQIEEPKLLIQELLELIFQLKALLSWIVGILGSFILMMMIMVITLSFEFRKSELDILREMLGNTEKIKILRSIELFFIFCLVLIATGLLSLLFFQFPYQQLQFF